jgi:hypothetical protein
MQLNMKQNSFEHNLLPAKLPVLTTPAWPKHDAHAAQPMQPY